MELAVTSSETFVECSCRGHKIWRNKLRRGIGEIEVQTARKRPSLADILPVISGQGEIFSDADFVEEEGGIRRPLGVKAADSAITKGIRMRNFKSRNVE